MPQTLYVEKEPGPTALHPSSPPALVLDGRYRKTHRFPAPRPPTQPSSLGLLPHAMLSTTQRSQPAQFPRALGASRPLHAQGDTPLWCAGLHTFFLAPDCFSKSPFKNPKPFSVPFSSKGHHRQCSLHTRPFAFHEFPFSHLTLTATFCIPEKGGVWGCTPQEPPRSHNCK